MIEEFKIAFGKLLNSSPYYSYWIGQTEIIFDKSISTACLELNTKSFQLKYKFNPDWFKSLTENERVGILQHEVMHDTLLHCFRSDEFPDRKIANYAMDIYINGIIINYKSQGKQFLLKGALYFDSFPNLKLLPNESDGYYYRELMKAQKNKEEKGTSGDKDFDNLLGGDYEFEHQWENLQSDEYELVKNLVQNKINSKIEDVISNCSIGELPLCIQEMYNKSKQPVFIPWQKVFRSFIGNKISTDLSFTKRKPNFRYPESAGKKIKTKLKILFCIDASGSISEQDFIDFDNEVEKASKQGVTVDCCQWDVECSDIYEYSLKRPLMRLKSGGTNASCALKKANQLDYNLVVILTDGFIEANPIKSKHPCLWVITSNGNDKINHNSKILKINRQ